MSLLSSHNVSSSSPPTSSSTAEVGASLAPVLTHRHIFGLKSDVTNGIHYLEDNCVIYPAGHNIILYSTDTKTQRFIHGSDVNGIQGRTEINTVAVSPNKRYIAVAERGVERGLINIYDVRTLKKKKTLYNSIDMKSKEYVSLCFSPDSKYLLSQGGAPDYTLINWLWGKTKPVQVLSVVQAIVQANMIALQAMQASAGLSASAAAQQAAQASKDSASATSAMTITTCSFCPSDPNIVCVTGKNVLQFLRIDASSTTASTAAAQAASAATSSSTSASTASSTIPLVSTSTRFKLMETSMYGRSTQEDYTCHAWIGGVGSSGGAGSVAGGNSAPLAAALNASGSTLPTSSSTSSSSRRLIVGTGDGQLLLLENGHLRGTLRTTLEIDNENALTTRLNASAFTLPKSIETITAYSNGFIIGCDSGVIKTYVTSNEDDSSYSLARSFSIHEKQTSKIRSLTVSPTDEHLICYTEDQQIYSLKNFHTDILKSEDMKFEGLFGGGAGGSGSGGGGGGSNNNNGTGGVSGFHTGAITGLDVCVRKPIVVTCGVDKTVRVWNYLNKTCELSIEFSEVPLSIALHPSGLHVLVGFTDKLRLMNILMDDIRCYKEFIIKSCSEVQFSHGGHMFAAMNIGLIQIYNTYTCELLWTFRGHTLPVKSLYWSLDDTNIVSAGMDGAVYERKIGQTARTQEYIQKGCKFTSAICTEDAKIYAVGDDQQLKEIIDKNINKTLNAGIILTQLCISNPPQRMLFSSTCNGVIRSFAFPLTGIVKDYQCHSSTITRMRITYDDAYLFTTGEDGLLSIFSIKEKDGRIPKNERPDRVPFSEEVLVTKSDLEEKNILMNELRLKVDELTASNEYQIRLHDINHLEKLKEISEKYELQIEHDKSRIDMMRDEKNELEMEYEERINQLKLSHSQILHLNDLEHQKSIMKEVTRFQKLQAELESESYSLQQIKQTKLEQHHQEYQQMKMKYDTILSREISESKQEQYTKSIVIREATETKEQLEEDIDKEIEQLKEKYDLKLATERDATLRLKGENGIMRKKFKALQKDIDDQTENIRTMYDKEVHLLTHIKNLEERITLHKSDIKERDKTIGENERTIYDLKKDNQELEKYKFVLDYQIKELKRQIEPRENDISQMKESVMKMDNNLESYHKENGLLKNEVNEMRLKLQKKQDEIQLKRSEYRRIESELIALGNDIYSSIELIQDPLELKETVRKLYQIHITEKIQTVELDSDVAKEYKRQKAYLDKSVDVLKKKLSKDLQSRRNDNMRLMQENVSLIKEINKLRREIKLMHQVQRQKELNTATRPQQPHEQDQWNEAEKVKLSEMQRTQIATLRMQLEEAQARLMHFRPTSSRSGERFSETKSMQQTHQAIALATR